MRRERSLWKSGRNSKSQPASGRRVRTRPQSKPPTAGQPANCTDCATGDCITASLASSSVLLACVSNRFFRPAFRSTTHFRSPSRFLTKDSPMQNIPYSLLLGNAPSVAPSASPHLFRGRYHLLEEVGRGTFSTVYRAEDRQNGRILAIKRF